MDISKEIGGNYRVTTMKDIALALNVSESTVSRALSGNTRLSIDMRNKVIRTAQEMNYFSNKPHSVLPIKTGTVGMVVAEINSNYYTQLIATVEQKLKKAGYTLLLGFSNFDNKVKANYLRTFAQKKVEGIICETTGYNEEIEDELKLLKLKYNSAVVVLREHDESVSRPKNEFDTISLDDYTGLLQMIDHLLGLGHRDIAFVGDVKSLNRANFFIKVMRSRGLEVREECIRLGEERFSKSGYVHMKEILALPKLPTAVIASYDTVALGAQRAILEAGLSIPGDISVAGIDNDRESPYFTPNISSVNRISDDMGDMAVGMLLNRLNNKNINVVQEIIIRAQFIARESTGPARQ